jgi:hypothetical protein
MADDLTGTICCQILLVQFRSEHYRARYLNRLAGSRIAIPPVGGKGTIYGRAG